MRVSGLRAEGGTALLPVSVVPHAPEKAGDILLVLLQQATPMIERERAEESERERRGMEKREREMTKCEREQKRDMREKMRD